MERCYTLGLSQTDFNPERYKVPKGDWPQLPEYCPASGKEERIKGSGSEFPIPCIGSCSLGLPHPNTRLTHEG